MLLDAVDFITKSENGIVDYSSSIGQQLETICEYLTTYCNEFLYDAIESKCHTIMEEQK